MVTHFLLQMPFKDTMYTKKAGLQSLVKYYVVKEKLEIRMVYCKKVIRNCWTCIKENFKYLL